MRQHYVPQVYLQHFTDPSGPEPGVWVVDGATGSAKPLRTDAIAAIGNYYTVNLEGQKDDCIEEEFAGLEAAIAPLLKSMNEGNLRISDDERALISEFMAAQVIRVPTFRNAVERSLHEVTTKLSLMVTRDRSTYGRVLLAALPDRDFTKQEIDRIWSFAREPAHYTIRVNPEISIGQGLKLAEALAPIFAGMQWSFLRTAGTLAIVTSDNPVSWGNPEFTGSAYGHGLTALGTEVVWPVGRRLALVATWRGSEEVVDAAAELTAKVDRRVISMAQRYVFCPSEAMAQWVQEHRSRMLAEKQ